VPAGAQVVVCEQSVEHPASILLEFEQDFGARAAKLRGRLGLELGALERWATLSPGERKRWQLAAALSQAPEILILDEPTNHVDGEALQWLRSALAGYRGVGLLISHDRELLDGVTHQTLRCHAGRATLYPGSYGAARQCWQQEREHSLAERQRKVDERDRLARRLTTTRADAAAAERNRSTKRRQRNAGDKEAASMAAKNLAQWAEAGLSRSAGKLRAELDRKQAQIGAFEVDKTLGRSVFAEYEPAKKAHLAHMPAGTLQVCGRPLLTHSGLVLGREDRIWLSGNNGAGKTTLLQALRACCAGEASVYLPQELESADVRDLGLAIQALPSVARGHLFSIVAALGVDPEHLRASSAWSPGEARKAMIAFGFASQARVLWLDEPTNHLDLPSIERLQEALLSYPGALVVVSHDTAFASAVLSTRWSIEDNGLRISDVV
jgi:ATPase subunit of ABC transporter with duplicated ATPase domains